MIKKTAVLSRPAGRKPALLGGKPAFEAPMPITMPTIPPVAALKKRYDQIFKTGMLTNASNVREFEAKTAAYLGVKNIVATNSCTSGLILVLKALGVKGEVVLPSFTFHATAHAAIWNNLTPVFVDCDPQTYTIDPAQVEKAITSKTSAILATHIFGNPCDVEALEGIAKKYSLKLVFDAAHAAGTQRKGKNAGGWGSAQSFSLSPTKLMTAGEGGLVATNDDALAKEIRIGRNYGDSGDYDCAFSGFNARMSELHAAIGIESLKMLEENVARRNRLAERYRKSLSHIPGITFQKIAAGDRSSYKDFAIVIDEASFGLGRNKLCDALAAENIVVKKYFYPPVHRQKAYLRYANPARPLPVTDKVSANTLSLPLFSHMPEGTADKISDAVARIKEHADML